MPAYANCGHDGAHGVSRVNLVSGLLELDNLVLKQARPRQLVIASLTTAVSLSSIVSVSECTQVYIWMLLVQLCLKHSE